MIKLGGLVGLNPLNEVEGFTATSKETGTTSVFKTKAARDAAIKAGTHEKRKDDKETPISVGKDKETPKVNIFNKDKEEPKSDSPKRHWVAYDKNHSMDTDSGIIVPKGKESDNPNPKDVKGIDRLSNPSSEPTKDSSGDRAGKPEVNKSVRAKADSLEITPEKLGEEDYQDTMVAAAHEALVDSNFHSEARKLLAIVTGDEKLAEKPDYPKMDDPKFSEKMYQISKDREAANKYTNPENDKANILGQTASSEAGWGGEDALYSITSTLREKGFNELADKMDSIFDEEDKNESVTESAGCGCGCGCGGSKTKESVNEGQYKTIMSNGGRNLFFAVVDDKTDKVDTIDLKKWLKTSLKDKASEDSKNKIVKAILKGQKQFNKSVEYNMWSKKGNPSFEDKINYFIKNGFINNITSKGIKVYESTESIKLTDIINEDVINEGTRSQVGIIKNGKIVSAYVHFDGYPSNMKPGLKAHMKDEKDVVTLIKKGGARGIFDDKPIEYYKQGTPLKGDVKNIEDYLKDAGNEARADYVYLYNTQDKKWYYADVYSDKKLKKLY